MLSDQVSQPRRCNGNSAAVLPTLPQATQDCTESTVGMFRAGPNSCRSNTRLMSRKMITPLATNRASPATCIAPLSHAWAMNSPASPMTVNSGIASARFFMSSTSRKAPQSKAPPSSRCFSRRKASAIAPRLSRQPAQVITRSRVLAGDKSADHGEQAEDRETGPEGEPSPEGARRVLGLWARLVHAVSSSRRAETGARAAVGKMHSARPWPQPSNAWRCAR